MKKLFTILMAMCFVVTVSAQQQLQKTAQNVQSSSNIEKTDFPPMPKGTTARIILRAGDVWGDGTGYQMLLDVTHQLFGTTIPATGPLTQSGDVPASVYAQFSHKIPANADGALNTTNMILNSEGYVDVPAGVYDFCITNPSPATPPYNVMWIAGGQNSRKDDYTFLANKIYIFQMYMVSSTEGDGATITTTAVSVEEVSATDLIIYPNPAKTTVNISAFSNIQRVEVYNLVGQLVVSQNFNAELVNINVADLNNGLYIAKVITTEGTMTQKFNIAR
jgi:hypothetical protein